MSGDGWGSEGYGEVGIGDNRYDEYWGAVPQQSRLMLHLYQPHISHNLHMIKVRL
jgi:hypothetical protein